MEIKNVEEEPIKEYPTQDEVSNTKLRKSIPKKWKVLGISALTLTMTTMLVLSGCIVLMIFNSAGSGGLVSYYASMTQQEKDQHNQKFIAYEGTTSGSTVKTLISTVISHNHQMEIEDWPERCVSIKSNHHTYKDATQLTELRNTIVNGARYKVTLSINDNTSLVDEISIERINNN